MRNKRLDVLRCIAILLVLFYHGGVVEYLARAGWMGGDLFFVLSGFLISGLMFSEYRKNGTIQFKRFFIRRGFKIYPAFYSFVAFIALIELYRHHFSPFSKYLHEIFFVQSYWLGIWVYTWSLAVEEHFYTFSRCCCSCCFVSLQGGKIHFGPFQRFFLQWRFSA